MPDLLVAGTNRGYSMIGNGIGLGVSGFRLATSGFSPRTLSGLQIWLDASDLSTVFQSEGGSYASADGDPVGYWMDKSGNAWHASQASGTNKAAFRTNVQNGRPIIRFDGVNDYLDTAGPETTTANLHAFVIVKSLANAAYAKVFRWAGTLSNNGGYSAVFYDGGVNFDVRASNGQELSGGVFRATTDITTAFNGYEFTFDSTPKTGEIFKSGVSLGTSTNASINTLLATSRFMRIGQGGLLASPAGTYWGGDLAELVVYDSIKTGDELTAIRNYFTTKWGAY